MCFSNCPYENWNGDCRSVSRYSERSDAHCQIDDTDALVEVIERNASICCLEEDDYQC